MQSTKTEMLKSKSVGEGAVLKPRRRRPPTPPKNAPIANDHASSASAATPIAAAAISSSRIAIQARPSRESRSRTEQKTVTSSSASAVQ